MAQVERLRHFTALHIHNKMDIYIILIYIGLGYIYIYHVNTLNKNMCIENIDSAHV